MNARISLFRKVILPVVIILSTVLCFELFCIAQLTLVEDKEFFFTISIPSNWNIKRSTDITSLWRISVTSPDGKMVIGFYAVKGHGDIDLDKLAAMDYKMFENLGSVSASRRIKTHYFWTKAIEKNYSKNNKGIYAIGRFTTDGTYGYIMLAFSNSDDFSIAYPVFESFKADVPFFTNIKNRLSKKESKSSSEIVKDLIVAILLFTIPVGLGILGYATRDYSWGLALCIILPIAIGGCLILIRIAWWISAIASVVTFALMGVGRFGIIMWLEED